MDFNYRGEAMEHAVAAPTQGGVQDQVGQWVFGQPGQFEVVPAYNIRAETIWASNSHLKPFCMSITTGYVK